LSWEYSEGTDLFCGTPGSQKIFCARYTTNKKDSSFHELHQFPVNGDIKFITSYHHLCFLERGKELKCIFNRFGKGMLADTVHIFELAPIQVSIGGNIFCAIFSQGKVECKELYLDDFKTERDRFLIPKTFSINLKFGGEKFQDIKMVQVSFAHMKFDSICLLTEKGQVFCQTIPIEKHQDVEMSESDLVGFSLPISDLLVYQENFCGLDQGGNYICFRIQPPSENQEFTFNLGKAISNFVMVNDEKDKVLHYMVTSAFHACVLVTDRKIKCIDPSKVLRHDSGVPMDFGTQKNESASVERFEYEFQSPVKNILGGHWTVCGETAIGQLECFWNHSDRGIYSKGMVNLKP